MGATSTLKKGVSGLSGGLTFRVQVDVTLSCVYENDATCSVRRKDISFPNQRRRTNRRTGYIPISSTVLGGFFARDVYSRNPIGLRSVWVLPATGRVNEFVVYRKLGFGFISIKIVDLHGPSRNWLGRGQS